MPKEQAADAESATRAEPAPTWSGVDREADNEREQAVVRCVLVGCIGVYFGVPEAAGLADPYDLSVAAATAFGYLLISLGILGWTRVRPRPSPIRRLVGMALDMGLLSVAMIFSGPWGAPLYPVFLWITFGNGFRFGNRYLAASATFSVLGFGAAIAFTPFWRESAGIEIGLLIGLIALPAYVATLVRKLTEAKRLAEEASNAKSRFLATMSHELRTPLNAVIGLSELLRRTPLDRGQAEMAETIGASGQALLSLINDILDMSKIESGKIELAERDFCLADEMADTIAIARAQAGQKGLGMALHFDAGVPPRVNGDPRILRQILLNLLANAVKFTDHGGVVLHVGAYRGNGVQGPGVRFEVIDTGIGIAEADQVRIFDAFTQSDEDAARRHGGTGLGLAIVKQLAERHGGRIALDSTFGAGSRFTVDLPLAQVEPAGTDAEIVTQAPEFVAATPPAPELRSVIEAAGLTDPMPPASLDADVATGPGATACLLLDLRREENPAQLAERIAMLPGIGPAGALIVDDRREPDTALLFAVGTAVSVSGTPDVAGLRRAASLLAALLHKPAQTGDQEATSKGVKPAAHACRVLVAEDNAVNRKVIARILETAGHTPVLVESGDAALDALESEAFDTVLMDVNMPGESGIETVKMFHFIQPGSAAKPPVIAVSADATEETRRACLDAGMADFLTKPIDAPKLLDTISRHAAPAPPEPAATPEAAGAGGAGATPVAESRAEALADMPVIDRAALDALRDLEDDDGFLRDVVREFLAETAELMTQLRGAAARPDAVDFRDTAHAIKSASGNVGAARLREVAAGLQVAARQDPESVPKLSLSEVQQEFDAYRSAISAEVGPVPVAVEA